MNTLNKPSIIFTIVLFKLENVEQPNCNTHNSDKLLFCLESLRIH